MTPTPDAGMPQPRSDLLSANPLQQAIVGLLRHRRWLLLFPLVSAFGAAALALVLPKRYEGSTIFTPSQETTSSLPTNLQAIASQFGISTQGSGYSIYFFAQVLQSREALRHVASDTLRLPSGTASVLDLLGASGRTLPDRLEDGIKQLPHYIHVRTDDQSNLVTLRILAPSPEAAKALVESFLRAVNNITMASLNAGGSFEWRFAQAQADSAREELRKAEDALRQFYLNNRTFQSSPTLQTQEARLQREIQIRRDVYVTLVQQAEAAKLQAVRNTPAITVVQPPQASTEKASPKVTVWAVMAALGAFTFSLVWIYIVRPLLPPRPAV